MAQTIKIHDVATGEIFEREMSLEEIAVFENRMAEAEAEAQTKAADAQARQTLLEKLGITENEARLLLS